jgi:hypothetical protein
MSSALGVDGNVRGRQRKKRADCGSVRFSERDGQLLQLVAEQYAISIDQLARLVGRSYRTGRWLRDRWRNAGWIESRQLTSGGASFLWLSGEGIRVAQSPYRRWRPNPGMAAHIEAVTEVRLLLEQELHRGSWLCERALARSIYAQHEGRPHLPDGLLANGEEQIAIEVELSLKSRARLEAIIDELAQTYAQVWYFALPPLLSTLGEVAAAAPWQNVSVYEYPPRPGDLRA